jgi:hypothetical protein
MTGDDTDAKARERARRDQFHAMSLTCINDGRARLP